MRGAYAVLLLLALASGLASAVDISSCTNITSPGSYQLTADLTGHPNSYGGVNFCIRIASSDVTLDCNGHTVTNPTVDTSTYGISPYGTGGTRYSNVVVQNCPNVSGYYLGIYFLGIDGGSITNSVVGNTLQAFSLYNDTGITVSGVTALNSSIGFALQYGASSNTISGSRAERVGAGFIAGNSDHDNNVLMNVVDNCAGSSSVGVNAGGSNDLFGNNTISDCAFGFEGFGSGNKFINNTVFNASFAATSADIITNPVIISKNRLYNCTYGFYSFSGLRNLIFSNNEIFGATGESAIYLRLVNYSNFDGNTIHDNAGYALYSFLENDHNNLTNSVAWNNSDGGFLLDGSYNNIINNTATGTGFNRGFETANTNAHNFFANNTASNFGYGFYDFYSDYGVFINNTANNNIYGFNIYNGGIENLTWNTACNNSANGIYIQDVVSASYNYLANNTACNNAHGFDLHSVSQNTLVDNTAYGNTEYGIYLYHSNGQTIAANNLYDNLQYDLYLDETSMDCANTIENNTGSGGRPIYFSNGALSLSSIAASEVFLCQASGASLDTVTISGSDTLNNNGFVSYQSSYLSLNNVNSSGNFMGFNLLSDSQVNITNSAAGGNAMDGFLIGSGSVRLSGDVACNNLGAGFSIQGSANVLGNSTSCGNAGPGAMVRADGAILSMNRFYNNAPDFLFNNSGIAVSRTINLTGDSFDNPAGNNTYIANISLYDTVPAGEIYSVLWSGQPAPLPENYISFGQKFLNITPIAGNVSIFNLTFSWQNSELGGYNKYQFELWKYNASNWTNTNAARNPAANFLSLSGTSPGSVYGILQSTLSCPVVNDSQTYVMPGNLFGSINDASEIFPGASACVKLAGSNIVFDCNGSSIFGFDSGTTFGILVNQTSTNITIRNCPSVSGYAYGVYAYSASGSVIYNVTSRSNTQMGIFLNQSSYNVIDRSNAFDNGNEGISISGGSFNNVTNCTANYSQYAFHSFQSDYNLILNNTASSSQFRGFVIEQSNYTSFSRNRGFSCNHSAFETFMSVGGNYTNNTAFNNEYGFVIYTGSHDSFLDGNVLYNNAGVAAASAGITVYQSNGVIVSNNTIYSDWPHGLRLRYSDAAMVASNRIYNCSMNGTLVEGANATFIGGRFYNNGADIEVLNALSGAASLSMNGTVFESPAGILQYFTNLTVSDSVGSGEGYIMDWTPSISLPPVKKSFGQKFINMTAIAGSPSIDSVSWGWNESELVGYMENLFELWQFNESGWALLNDTPDTANNAIGLNAFSPSGTYALIQLDCIAPYNDLTITNYTRLCPGNFRVNDSGSAGVVIFGASNQAVSCINTTLSGYGTGTGFYASSKNNVSVYNCLIANYSTAINIDTGSGSSFINNTIANMTSNGIYVHNPLSHIIAGNLFSSIASTGVNFFQDNYNIIYGYSRIENNTFSGSTGATAILFNIRAYAGEMDYDVINNNSFGNMSYALRMVPDNVGYCAYMNIGYNRFSNNTVNNVYTAILPQMAGCYMPIRYNYFDNNTIANGTYGVNFPSVGQNAVSDNTFGDNNFTNMSLYAAYFPNDYSYRNDFGGTNTLDGYNFYHYYNRADILLDGLNRNETISRSMNATNLGLVTAVLCRNLTIANGNFSNDPEYGIMLYDNDGVLVENNSVVSNSGANLYLLYDNSTIIRSNNFSLGPWGTYSYHPQNGGLYSGNLFTNTTSGAIYFNNPYYDTISGNTFANFTSNGIYFYQESYDKVYGYSRVENNSITGPWGGTSILMNIRSYAGDMDNGVFNNNTIVNSTYAFRLVPDNVGYCAYMNIGGNRFSNNTCRNNYICFYPNLGGCYPYVRYNYFDNNTITNNTYGVYFANNGQDSVSNNTFGDNNFTNITIYAVYFAGEYAYRNHFGGTNTLDGYPFYHYYNMRDTGVSGLNQNETISRSINATNLGLVTLVNCRNFTVSNSNLSNDPDYGALLYDNDGALIENNTIASNSGANLYLLYDSASRMSGNNISYGPWGAYSYHPQFGSIFSNNSVQRTTSGVYYVNNPYFDIISNNTMNPASSYGIYLYQESYDKTYGYNVVDNNSISGPAGGSSIFLTVQSYAGWMANSNFTNNRISNAGNAFRLYSNNVGYCSEMRIAYNLFWNNTCQNDSICFYFHSNSCGAYVSYNTVNNNTVFNSTYGAYLSAGGSNYVPSNYFYNNYFNVTSYGLAIDNNQSPNFFTNNTFENNGASNFISANTGNLIYLTNQTFYRRGGSVTFAGPSLRLVHGLTSGNTLINPDMSSFDSSSLTELQSAPANVTANSSTCNGTVFRLAGFPSTWYQVVSQGLQCGSCVIHSCADNVTHFSVMGFSGYAVTGVEYPFVSLMSPDNNTVTISPYNTFTYNVTDFSANITSCSLIANNSAVASNSSITMGVPQSFRVLLVNDSYNWSVNCTDDSITRDTGSSESRALNVTSQMYVSENLNPQVANANMSLWASGIVNFTDDTRAQGAFLQFGINGTFSDMNLGDGSDGDLVVSSAGRVVNNYTFLTGNQSAGDTVLFVGNSSAFFPGDEVLIIQMQNGTGGTAGAFESAFISAATGNNITLAGPIVGSYYSGRPNLQPAFDAQVIRVPQYQSITVNPGAGITAPAWDGYIGGVVAFRVKGLANIQGTIDVSGKGYRGGNKANVTFATGQQGESVLGRGAGPETSPTENNASLWNANYGGGGGGGETSDSGDTVGGGGGGGGYGTAGTACSFTSYSARCGNAGNAYGSTTMSGIFLGSAGAAGGTENAQLTAGNGGNGGGAILIFADNLTIQGNGAISSNGSNGGSCSGGDTGSGGAGSGGSIWLYANNLALGTGKVAATGGIGPNSCYGAPSNKGGDGGLGRVHLDFSSVSGSTSPSSQSNGTVSFQPTAGTDAQGFYNRTFLAPASIGWYAIFVNASFYGYFANNSAFVLVNNPPVVSKPVIIPQPAFVDSNLSATTTYTNADGVPGNVTFTWYVNSVPVYAQFFESVADGTNVTAGLAPSNFSNSSAVYVSVYAVDPEGPSATVASDVIYIYRYLLIGYSPPTPPPGGNVSDIAALINVTINETGMSGVNITWNGTAYSMYDNSLVGMWSFDDMQWKDDFNGTVLNATKWVLSPGADYNTSQNNKFMFRKTAYVGGWTGTNLRSLLKVYGDYDVQLDYSDLVNNGSSDGGIDINVWNSQGSGFYIRRQYASGRYDSDVYTSGGWRSYTSTGTGDTSGKLRVARVGNVMYAYYWSGSSWTQLRSYTDNLFLGSTDIYIAFNFNNGQPGNAVSIDNFQINSGAPANDSSLAGQNSTILGATWTAGRFGNALNFNGASNSVYATYSASLAPTSGLTVAGWYNPVNRNLDTRIISKTEGGGYQLSLNENSACTSNTYCLLVNVGGTYYNASVPISSTTIGNGQWSYLAGTYDGETIRLYLNGAEIANNTDPSGSISYAVSNPMCIGAEATPTACSGSWANGVIDEVRVWNRGLTASEIWQQYSTNLMRYSPGQWILFSNQTGLVPGTYTYSACGSNQQGNPGCLETRNMTVRVTPHVTAPSIYPSQPVVPGRIWTNTTYTNFYGNPATVYFRWYSNGINTFNQTLYNITDGSTVESNLTQGLYPGENITVSVKANDGELDSNEPISNSVRLLMLPTVNSTIGMNHTSPPSAAWNKENLTVWAFPQLLVDNATYVYDWYLGNTSEAIVILPFDKNANPTTDYSGYGNNAVPNSCTWTSAGKRNGAYQINGYMTIPDSPTLDTPDQVTLEAWIKYNGWSSWDRIVGRWYGSCSDPWQVCTLHINDASHFSFSLSSAAPGTGFGVTATTTVVAGTWYHVVGTYDRNKVRIYVNGNLEAEGESNRPIGVNNLPYFVGGDPYCNENSNAVIDEVRIYNRSLSADEVRQHYLFKYESLVSNELRPGQNWSAMVYTEDNYTTLSQRMSNTLTVMNALPTQSQPILNSTNGTNTIFENLTVYNQSTYEPDNDSMTNIIDWRINGSSIALLNMPFDTFVETNNSRAVEDYSTWGNNGTMGGGVGYQMPLWNASGYLGGGFRFDGSNDYIDLGPATGSLRLQNEFTISAWVYPAIMPNDALWAIVSSQYDANFSGISLMLDSRLNPDGQTAPRRHIHFQIGDGSWHTTNTNAYWQNNTWLHVVATRKANQDAKIYVNGALQPSTSINWSGSVLYTSNWNIGRQQDLGRYFNGMIDEVRIYNRSLSAEQVLALYNNRTDIIVSNETRPSNVWSAAITPNDGWGDGNTSISNAVLTHLPVAINSVTTSQVPAANATLYLIASTSDANSSVNFTVVDPDGVVLVNNANGSTVDYNTWNSTPFTLNKLGLYNYTVIAAGQGGLIATYSGQLTFILVGMGLSPNPAFANSTVLVSGTVNFSNGSGVPNPSVAVYVNGSPQSALNLGDGSDGSLNVSSSGTIVNNYTYVSSAVPAGSSSITVADASAIQTNDEILVIQAKGTGFGTYEFKQGVTVAGNTISFPGGLSNSYDGTGTNRVEVVRVPNFQSVTVQPGASIVAKPWNGSIGGVIAFRASGIVNVSGAINASMQGFLGGSPTGNAPENASGYNTAGGGGGGGGTGGHCGGNSCCLGGLGADGAQTGYCSSTSTSSYAPGCGQSNMCISSLAGCGGNGSNGGGGGGSGYGYDNGYGGSGNPGGGAGGNKVSNSGQSGAAGTSGGGGAGSGNRDHGGGGGGGKAYQAGNNSANANLSVLVMGGGASAGGGGGGGGGVGDINCARGGGGGSTGGIGGLQGGDNSGQASPGGNGTAGLAGGGIILITSSSLDARSGQILSSGGAGGTGGNGGGPRAGGGGSGGGGGGGSGGAGGSIYLSAFNMYVNTASLAALGGGNGTAGSGAAANGAGAGGNGAIGSLGQKGKLRLDYTSLSGTVNSSSFDTLYQSNISASIVTDASGNYALNISVPAPGTYPVVVIATYGSLSGSASGNLTIKSPPSVTTPSVYPTPAYAGINLSANTTYTSPEGYNATVYFLWFVNNANRYNQTIINVLNGSTVTGNITPGYYTFGDSVFVSVYAYDGTGVTQVQSSPSVLIYNTIPEQGIPLLNSTFGRNHTSPPTAIYNKENLTVYNQSTLHPDIGNLTNIANWFLNGQSIAILNMPFDTNVSTNASGAVRDYSGYNNNGTLISFNATPAWVAGGHDGGAYLFHGGDVIDAGTFNPANPHNITMSAWINVDSSSNSDGYIIAKGNDASSNSYGIFVWSNPGFANGDLMLMVDTPSGPAWINTPASSLSAGQWYHVAGVISGNATRLYVNGQLLASGSFAGTISPSASSVWIGGQNRTSYQYNFKGYIDEARIYGRALTQAQIMALYLNRSDTVVSDELRPGQSWSATITPNDGSADGPTNTSNTLTVVDNLPTQSAPILNSTFNTNTPFENLTAYNQSTNDTDLDPVTNEFDWRLNGTSIAVLSMPFDTFVENNSAGAVRDYSTLGNNGTLGGGVLANMPSWNGSGHTGGAFQFDGLNDYLDLGNPPSLQLGNLTISLWYYQRGGPVSYPNIVGHGTNGWSFGISNEAGNTGKFFFAKSGLAPYVNSVTVLANNTWYHLAVTVIGSRTTLYVNGVNESASLSTPSFTFANNLRIGQDSTGGGYVNGTIDDVRIYNRSLSAEQILALFNNRTDLLVSNETRFGDVWTVAVTPNDAWGDGATLISNNVTEFGGFDIATNDSLINASTLLPAQYSVVTLNASASATASASNVNVSFLVDGTLNQSQLINVSAGNLSAQFSWNASQAGSHNLTIAFNADRAVPETNYLNNNASAQIMVSRLGAVNLTSPQDGSNFSRSRDTVSYPAEDGIGILENNITAIARVYDFNNASASLSMNCSFFLNQTLLGYNASDPGSGLCIFSFNRTVFEPGLYNLTVNITPLDNTTSPYPPLSGSTIGFNLIKFTTTLDAINTRAGLTYNVGDAAILNITTARNDSPFDPQEILVLVKSAADPCSVVGSPIFTHRYPGDIVRLGTGSYYAKSLVNASGMIHWCAYVADLDGRNVSSAPHSDRTVNAESANMTLVVMNNKTGEAGNSSATLYDFSLYQLDGRNLTSSASSFIRPATINSAYSENVTTPGSESIALNAFNFSYTNPTILAQFANAPASGLPGGVAQATRAIAMNGSAFNFSNATLYFRKAGLNIDRILYCPGWDFATASCPAWISVPGANYSMQQNTTHFWIIVNSFTGYAGGAGFSANLTIFDDTDFGSRFASQQVRFYANYSNSTSAMPINDSLASCNITFNASPNGPFAMSFNATSTFWEYNRTVPRGTHSWNVTCRSDTYDNLTANDTVTIVNSPPAVTAPVILPASPSEIDNLTATVNYSDADNDTGIVIFRWYVNGVNVWNSTSYGVANGSAAYSNLSSANFSTGAFVNVSATANDTFNASAPAWSDTKQVSNLPPTIVFNTQTPPDITAFNVLGRGLNVTYNISDNDGVLNNSVFIHFKTNSSISDCWTYVNGSPDSCGYQQMLYYSNQSSTWLFRLFDNQVYPAMYNFPERPMELTPHLAFQLNDSTQYIGISLLNVSNVAQYSFLEFMANSSGGVNPLQVFYCNSSYSSGDPSASAYCVNFYSLETTAPFNHTHSIYSSHMVVPFPINASTFSIGGVFITPVSRFLLQGGDATNWSVYYIANLSRQDAIANSSDSAASWSAFNGTVDSHIHQYVGNDTVYYYACANDTLGAAGCSAEKADLIDLGGLPPTAPDVISPLGTNYSGNLSISYTAAVSPNGYPIAVYNISLLNPDFSFNSTIVSNNAPSLGYLWDTTNTSDGSYVIRVQACDNNSLCSNGYSPLFSIDNLPPNITAPVISPSPAMYGANLSANTTYKDPEARTGAAFFRWYVNNANVLNQAFYNLSSDTTVISNLSSSFLNQLDYVNVSVYATDGFLNTTMLWSPTIRIQNIPPDLTAPLILPESGFKTTIYNASTVYSDPEGSPGNVTFVWLVSDVNVFNQTMLNVPSGTNVTSNITGLYFSKGDSLNCSVVANDSFNLSSVRFSINSLHVYNSPPQLVQPSIVPASGNVLVHFNASTYYTDADNDTGNVTFQWFINGAIAQNQTFTGIANGTSLTSNLTSLLNPNDVINLTVYAFDGENASSIQPSSNYVTVLNTAPQVTPPSMAPMAGYKNTTFNATTNYTHADSNPGNVTFIWHVNGINVYNQTLVGLLNGSVVTSNLTGQYFSHYDNLTAAVFAFDGQNVSPTMNGTDILSVLNSPPAVSAVTLVPDPLYSGTSPNASVIYSDLDSDPGTVTFMWFVNGTNVYNATYAGAANGTIASALLPTSYFGPSDIINVTVYAVDSGGASSTSQSSVSLTVLLSPFVSVTVSPSSGSPGDSISFFANITNASAVNVTIGGTTLLMGNGSATGWNYSGFTLPSLPGGATTVTFSALVGGSLFTQATTFTVIAGGIPPSPGGGQPPAPEISLSYSRSHCPSDIITISASAGSGTTIRLILYDPYQGSVGEKTTDSDGTAAFPLGTNGTYQAIGTKSGYSSATITFPFSTCAPPPQVECTYDTDCPINTTCTDSRCVPTIPPQGNVTPPTPGGGKGNISANCTSNSDCLSTLFCNGASGKCEPVKGKCGYPANHTWVSYECCDDKECAAGKFCRNNTCMQVAYAMSGKQTGFVGDNDTITVYSNDQPLANASLKVIAPDGSISYLNTGAGGDALLQLLQTGDYKVELLVDGVPVKSITVSALPGTAPPPVSMEKAIFDAIQKNADILLLLLALAVAAFLFYRYFFVERYGGKKAQ